MCSSGRHSSGLSFQSTLSVRRATPHDQRDYRRQQISIHALREESDRQCRGWMFGTGIISIHALREESDRVGGFQHLIPTISIHALREESDPKV